MTNDEVPNDEVDFGAESWICSFVTATGCGVSVRDYGRLLADDEDYAEKAKSVFTSSVALSFMLRSSSR